MATEEKSADRGTLATVIATAAVTLAIGVTAAALGGYLAPAGGTQSKPAEVTEPMVAEAPPAARPSTPNVVLVPVAPDSPSDRVLTAPAEPAAEVTRARYERTGDHDDDDDHHHGREHREREHEDDHDDD